MRQYRAMIRYCFPHVDIDAIEDEVEFADIANEADWIIRNVVHPQESSPTEPPSNKKSSGIVRRTN
tara:strand:+ start:188 stop:385 length:198 start_codon:yes stop_codon:yes gene_type:complete